MANASEIVALISKAARGDLSSLSKALTSMFNGDVVRVGGTTITATGTELNTYVLSLDIADGSADTAYYLVCPHGGTITKIWTAIDGVVSTADITITPSIGGVNVTGGVVTISLTGTVAGDLDSATPTAANVVADGGVVVFTVAGGGSGGSPRIHLAMEILRT